MKKKIVKRLKDNGTFDKFLIITGNFGNIIWVYVGWEVKGSILTASEEKKKG